MFKKFKIFLVICLLLGSAALVLWFFATQEIAVVNPKGIVAHQQKTLLITATWLMLIVVVPVLIMTCVFAWKYREGNKNATYTPDWDHSHVAECIWWGVPCVIVLFLALITWSSSHALDPYKPLASDKKPLKIQVVALDWKWLFIYPEQGIATVNYLQFPEQTPIHFEITADAPMNSFWIPQLGGQIYAMPAMKTELHLMASEVGTFRGASSNLSGRGFAGMVFTAEAVREENFEDWVRLVRRQGSPLTQDSYQVLAAPSESHPMTLYKLKQADLFDQIVMQYRMPRE